MSLIENLKKIGENALRQKDLLHTEEATKNALIMPFIQALGYNVFDPREVRPEYTADFDIRQNRKVDYAILIDDFPAILFECKALGVALDSHRAQLASYFSAINDIPEVHLHFGVLTNGQMYQFYADLDKDHVMDKEPFLEFNLSKIQETLGEELQQKITKINFNVDIFISWAEELKYTRKIKQLLDKEYETPTPEFVEFCMGSVDDVPKFTGFVKKAFREFVGEHSASADTVESNNEPVATSYSQLSTQMPLVRLEVNEPVAPEPATPPTSDEREWQPISKFRIQPSDPTPTNILFLDNSQVSIQEEKDILVEIARWLIDKKILNEGHCPLLISDSSVRYIISTEPKHSHGKPFTTEAKVGSFYIETKCNNSTAVDRTRTLIKHVGQDPSQFKVR